MALHFKSNKLFKYLVGISAFLISFIAAVFSVTGVSALFAGNHNMIAIMMSVLEFGKIVTASFVARFWNDLSKIFKSYFTIATIILILITSSGIFGYLSDSYQKVKGNYDVVIKEMELFDKKIEIFKKERDRYEIQIKSQDERLNILYSNQQNATNKRIDSRIKSGEGTITDLNKKLSLVNDSISYYETQKVQKESSVSSGELGPLKYMANIFNTDMDTIVKYFIYMLIFVFDPLAILLFVSLNTIIKKEEDEKIEDPDDTQNGNDKKSKLNLKKISDGIKKLKGSFLKEEEKEVEVPNENDELYKDAILSKHKINDPNKKSFTIDVGNIPLEKTNEYMKNIIEGMKQPLIQEPDEENVVDTEQLDLLDQQSLKENVEKDTSEKQSFNEEKGEETEVKQETIVNDEPIVSNEEKIEEKQKDGVEEILSEFIEHQSKNQEHKQEEQPQQHEQLAPITQRSANYYF